MNLAVQSTLALSWCAALSLPVSATVLTVGPTGQFAQIADAIAAAQPNDVILVAPGTYNPIEIQKPVHVLADGTGDVLISNFGARGIVVRQLAEGEEVVVSGIDVSTTPFFGEVAAQVHVVDCDGTVVLNDLTIDSPSGFVSLYAENSERVLLLRSDLPSGGPESAVYALASELWVVDSNIECRLPATGFTSDGFDAVVLDGSDLHVWRSTIRGGDAVLGKPTFFDAPDGGDGIDAVASTITLYGGASGGVFGGQGQLGGVFAPNGSGGVGIRLAGASVVTLQEDVDVLGGFDGTGAFQAPATVDDGSSTILSDPASYPLLATSTPHVAGGGSFTIDVDGSVGGVAVLFASFETGPTLELVGIGGAAVLSPGLFLQLGVLPLGASGQASLPATVPAAPALLGVRLFLQGAEAGVTGVSITNPALVSVTQ